MYVWTPSACHRKPNTHVRTYMVTLTLKYTRLAEQASVTKSTFSEGLWACMYVWKPSACTGKMKPTRLRISIRCVAHELMSILMRRANSQYVCMYGCIYVCVWDPKLSSKGWVRFLTNNVQYLNDNALFEMCEEEGVLLEAPDIHNA